VNASKIGACFIAPTSCNVSRIYVVWSAKSKQNCGNATCHGFAHSLRLQAACKHCLSSRTGRNSIHPVWNTEVPIRRLLKKNTYYTPTKLWGSQRTNAIPATWHNMSAITTAPNIRSSYHSSSYKKDQQISIKYIKVPKDLTWRLRFTISCKSVRNGT